MKSIILLICILVSSSLSQTCGENPIINKFEAFFEGNKAWDSFQAAFDAYKLSTPVALGTDGEGKVGHCSALFTATDQVCCTKSFFKSIKDLLKAKGKDRAQGKKKPPALMLLRKVDKALKKCNGSAPDGEDNPTIKIAHEINKCFAQSVRDQMRFQRGLLCSLCVAPADYADFFGTQVITETLPDETSAVEGTTQQVVSKPVKINKASFDKYSTAAGNNMSCMDKHNAQLKTSIEELLATASSKKCDKVKEKVKAMLAAGNVKNCDGDTCKNKCIDAAQPFGKDCLEEAVVEEDQMDVEGTSTTSSAKTHSIRRVLGVNESIELVETGGVQAYVSDSEDDSLIPKDAVAPPPDDNSSTLINFALFTLLALVSLIF